MFKEGMLFYISLFLKPFWFVKLELAFLLLGLLILGSIMPKESQKGPSRRFSS